MEKMFISAFFLLIFLRNEPVTGSSIKIINNGYENITVALPAAISVEDGIKWIVALQKLFQQSSALLREGTKGRAYFRSVTFLIPRTWSSHSISLLDEELNVTIEEAGAAFFREGVDIVVTDQIEHGYPYTLHQGGCGRQALRIHIPTSFLHAGLEERQSEVFAQLWSEYRYGIFLEIGFEDDEKFPVNYYIPGDTRNRTTGCNLEYFRTPKECNDNGECQTVETFFANNGPDFHTRNSLFCEGHLTLSGRNHNPEAPSKHNLLCKEEGTLFTVLRNNDFKHGMNAAREEEFYEDVSFRYLREVNYTKVVVAIEISSRMRQQDRYALVKNAFSHFLLSELPDRSELSLAVFGGGDNTSLISVSLTLEGENDRINYLERQPLPELPSDKEDVCIDCVLEEIVNLTKEENSSFTSAPTVVLVTTQSALSRYGYIRELLEGSEIRLHVLSFADSDATDSLYELCSQTGNEFVSVEGDTLRNLYRAFSDVIKEPNLHVLITQDYLITLDEENIRTPFTLDASLSSMLKVSLTGPFFTPSPLEYEATALITPGGQMLMPRKMELVPSWVFYLSHPQAGEYVLKTRRKRDAISPVMLTIKGSSEKDPITARVWVEVLEWNAYPPPMQIFAEVKQGSNPVRNATAIAFVHHPGMDGISRVRLLDDGLGSIDITKDDGIYSSFFTNFTSKGFYNVYVQVTGGFDDYSEILKGPSTACCGSTFPATERNSAGKFQREDGPVTFEVTALSDDDIYPPAMVTNLRIVKSYDQLVVLHWTAVGDDFESGVAAFYEVKLLPDRFAIRNRFSDSGLELYSERIDSTPLATYGTNLFHQLQLPKVPQRGVYYISVRAIDEAGNAGEPSNVVPVWLKQKPNSLSCSSNKLIAMELISGNRGTSLHIASILAVVLSISISCYTALFTLFKTGIA